MKNLILIIIFNVLSFKAICQEDNIKDRIPALRVIVYVEGLTKDLLNYKTDKEWFFKNNCLKVRLDTIFIPNDENTYVNYELTKLLKHKRKLKKDKSIVEKLTKNLHSNYNNFVRFEEYDTIYIPEIIQFNVFNIKWESGDLLSNTSCFSENQLEYLSYVKSKDCIYIKDIKVQINDNIYKAPAIAFDIIE